MDKDSIGYKIRILRQNSKLTQEKLAEKTDLYLEFDDHMRQLFSVEFYKRLIVQYLRE